MWPGRQHDSYIPTYVVSEKDYPKCKVSFQVTTTDTDETFPSSPRPPGDVDDSCLDRGWRGKGVVWMIDESEDEKSPQSRHLGFRYSFFTRVDYGPILSMVRALID